MQPGQRGLHQTLSDGRHHLDALEGVTDQAEAYGFSRRFGWVQDRFGVSWQINAA